MIQGEEKMKDFKNWYNENSINERKRGGVKYKRVTRPELLKFADVFTRLMFQFANPKK